MTPAETVEILRQFNEWRRGGDGDQPDPKQIGAAIDAACEMIERLDRGERAWSDVLDATAWVDELRGNGPEEDARS